MNWILLSTTEQLDQIRQNSAVRPQLIFKHSTRCAISSVSKGRLERNTAPEGVDFYFLDLLAHRQLSQKIAADFNVPHESPQVLLIKNGVCVYNESHSGINMDDIAEQSLAA